MDSLTALLTHFSLQAGVFYSGTLCGIHHFRDDAPRGHIHLIKRGSVRLAGARGKAIKITEPSLLFLPYAGAHRLIVNSLSGADVVCGTVQFGGGGRNPIIDSLPEVIFVKLAALPGSEALLNLMFDEAFSKEWGRQAALDRLCEVLMIRLLRYCLDQGLTRGGTLAGMADSRLSKALTAVHEDPAREWNLPEMAALSGMSRARFAVRFREVTGETPADYLASWRIIMAQRMLKKGLHIKHVALDVGYGSASAFTRAFIRKVGSPPAIWVKRENGSGDGATQGTAKRDVSGRNG